MAALIAFDLLLAVTLAAVAWAALAGTQRFRSVVLFVVFGILVAVAWVRLGAVDLALAEAAIGAGITGSLLMAVLDRLRRVGDRPEPAPPMWPAVAVAALVAVAGAAALLAQPPTEGPPVDYHLDASGVSHSVTAVLLAFRAYDTLLEIAVLLAAGLAVHTLGLVPQPPATEAGSLQRALLRLVAPFLVVLAAYLLWRGSHAPGGAFQAGAVLAAAGIFAQLTHFPGPLDYSAAWQRPGAVAGLAIFVAAALATGARGVPLAWPAASAKAWILTIEIAATLSIAVLLCQLFAGGRPMPRKDR